MLVLSRHRDESIMIGDDVVVTIVDIRGDKVRLRYRSSSVDSGSPPRSLRSDSTRESPFVANERCGDEEREAATRLIPSSHREIGNRPSSLGLFHWSIDGLSSRSPSVMIVKPFSFRVSIAISMFSTMIATAGLPLGRTISGYV